MEDNIMTTAVEEINVDQISETLNSYVEDYEFFKSFFKIQQYLGGILPGLNIALEFFSGLMTRKNSKEIIKAYAYFVQNVEANESLQAKYPKTYSYIQSAKVYIENPTINDIASFCFDQAFQTIKGKKSEIYIEKESLKAYEEFMNGINSGECVLFYYPPATGGEINSVIDLYNLLIDTPDMTDIPFDTMAYRGLALAYWAIKNRGASVFCTYYDPTYINQQKSSLTFASTSTYFQVQITAVYPVDTSASTTLYWNRSTYTWEETSSGSGISVTMPARDTSKTIDSVKFTYPDSPYLTPNAAMHFYDSSGVEITNVEYSTNNNLAKAHFMTPVFYNKTNFEGHTEEFSSTYYRERMIFTTGNQYGDHNYWSQNYNNRYPFFQNAFTYDQLKTIIDGDYLKYGWYIKDGSGASPEEQPVKMEIEDSYGVAYDNGGVELVDKNNGDSVLIKLPDDQTSANINNGTANVTDVMEGNGNYVIDQDGNPIKTPESTSEEKPNAPDTSGPNLNLWGIPSGLFTIYMMSQSAITRLGRQLYTPDVFDTLKRVFADPMQSIISLGFIPFIIDNTVSTQVTIGGYETGIYGGKLLNQYKVFWYPDISIPKYRDDSFGIDDPYSEWTIYIPYCGSFTIPSGAIVGHTISIQARLDIVTGDMVNFVYTSGNGTQQKKFLLGTYIGNCMRTCPISQSSGNAILNTVLKVGGGLASIGATAVNPIAGMVVSGVTSQIVPGSIAPSVTTNGTVGGNVGFLGVRNPFVTCRRKDFNGQNVQVQIGRWMNVSGLSGYVEATNFRTNSNSGGKITSDEMNELTGLLASGVVL